MLDVTQLTVNDMNECVVNKGRVVGLQEEGRPVVVVMVADTVVVVVDMVVVVMGLHATMAPVDSVVVVVAPVIREEDAPNSEIC